MAFTHSTNDDPLRWLSGRTQARRCSNCFPHAAHYPTKNPTTDRCSRAHIFRVFPFYHQMWILQLSKSLKTGLSHLSDPETPTLVQLIISTWLNLALKVDEPNSLELFDHLSVLVGTGIIEGIWIYSIQNIVAMKATLDALPSVLRTLGIATASFLKVRSIFQTARVAISSHKNSVDYTSTRAYNGNAKHYARTTRKHHWYNWTAEECRSSYARDYGRCSVSYGRMEVYDIGRRGSMLGWACWLWFRWNR